MARWRIAWLALFLALLTVPALAENRALLIGCDHFLTQDDTSPASENNVLHMARALSGGSMNLASLVTRRTGLGRESELQELIQEAFGEATEEDTCYFYISTHGLWEEGQSAGEFTLLLSDGHREHRLAASRLKELLEPVPGTKVLILDACHSGAVIGKGVPAPFDRLFEGEEWKIVCSSGGAEESWFWAGAEDDLEQKTGAGYFSDTLVRGISGAGGFASDLNRDGTVTLRELKRYLRANHGASTVQTWPEESDFPLMTYDVNTVTVQRRAALVEGISLETGALSFASPSIQMSFTVLSPLRMVYQLVYQQGGRWDFDNAVWIYDDGEDGGLLGNMPGALTPGFKERTITLQTPDEDYGDGYVLLQLLALTGQELTVVGGTVLCIPPVGGDPELLVEVPEAFDPSRGEELSFSVAHSLPCEITVLILDGEGKTVRRLVSREPTRPEQLNPSASTYTWSGLTAAGELVPPGTYTLRVTAIVGDERWEADDRTFAIIRREDSDEQDPETL